MSSTTTVGNESLLLAQSFMNLFYIPFHHIVIAVAVFPFFRNGIREQIAVNGKIPSFANRSATSGIYARLHKENRNFRIRTFSMICFI